MDVVKLGVSTTMGTSFRRNSSGSRGFDLILRAIALAFNDHGFGVVEEEIEDGGGDGIVDKNIEQENSNAKIH
jgi:hypothetical protein